MAAQATTISVIAEHAGELSAAVDAVATNVHTVPEPDDDLDARARWREVTRKPPVYVLVPFDPLQALVDAWAAMLSGDRDDLELVVGTLAKPDLPDYYVVEERLADPARAWYFELLYSLAPARVVAFDRSVDGLVGAIRTLHAGRSLPDVATLVDQARTFVPGTTGLVKPAKPHRIHVM